MTHQKGPGIPCQCTKLHLLAFFSYWKCHLKKSMTQFGIWSLHCKWDHGTQLPGQVRSGFVLVPWSSWGIPGESVGDASLWTWEDCLREAFSPWITNGYVFSNCTSLTGTYQQMSFPFCHHQQLYKKALENYSFSRNAFFSRDKVFFPFFFF